MTEGEDGAQGIMREWCWRDLPAFPNIKVPRIASVAFMEEPIRICGGMRQFDMNSWVCGKIGGRKCRYIGSIIEEFIVVRVWKHLNDLVVGRSVSLLIVVGNVFNDNLPWFVGFGFGLFLVHNLR